jgi:hypothetical protein
MTNRLLFALLLLFCAGSIFAFTGFGESGTFGITDETLPVELSSFTAIVTASNFVQLDWVTQSETALLGFNLYRSQTGIFNNPLQLNQVTISASNTSEQHSYTILDKEVENNNTYYYWLESIEQSAGSTMHGPVTVTVTGSQNPIVTGMSLLNSAYPNPFHTSRSTNISVSVKTGETGSVTIYNLRGQTVKTFPLTAGTYNLTWDGNGSSSGIYFYKLITPSVNIARKLVLLK